MCIPCDIVTGVAQPFSKSSWNWRIFLFQVGPEVFSSWPDVFELHTSVYIHIQSYSVWLSRTDAIDIWTSVGMASLSALCFVLRIRNPPKAKLWGTKSSMAWHGGSSVDLCTTVIHSDPQWSTVFQVGDVLGLGLVVNGKILFVPGSKAYRMLNTSQNFWIRFPIISPWHAISPLLLHYSISMSLLQINTVPDHSNTF